MGVGTIEESRHKGLLYIEVKKRKQNAKEVHINNKFFLFSIPGLLLNLVENKFITRGRYI
jgi:hypothetical protein